MKVDHIFGGHIYVLSNYGVARNQIFSDQVDLEFFKQNMEKYLSEICDIYAYSHQSNQFQYLVKIKDRHVLENFFYKKRSTGKKKNVSHNIYDPNAQVAPESYLIFSQEVSNCLNSYVKKFNFRHDRKGGLFGDRYCKELVETEEEMNYWTERLNQMQELVTFTEEWRQEVKIELGDSRGECSSQIFYKKELEEESHKTFSTFVRWTSDKLRGYFDCLPPHNRKASNFDYKFNLYAKIKGIAPPW